jgi:NADH:ubiquinone oxidoreductase subunit K
LSARPQQLEVHVFLYAIGTVGCVSSHFVVNYEILLEIVCKSLALDFRKCVRPRKAWQSYSPHTFQFLYEPSIAIKVSIRLEIALTRHTSMSNINIINRNVLAAPFSAKNVIVPPLLSSSARNIPDRDILDHNAIGGISSRTAVEVILLYVDAVNRYILNTDILEENV